MERLDTVEKPWEDWELRFNVAAAPTAARWWPASTKPS